MIWPLLSNLCIHVNAQMESKRTAAERYSSIASLRDPLYIPVFGRPKKAEMRKIQPQTSFPDLEKKAASTLDKRKRNNTFSPIQISESHVLGTISKLDQERTLAYSMPTLGPNCSGGGFESLSMDWYHIRKKASGRSPHLIFASMQYLPIGTLIYMRGVCC
jgi:hypothetical protein